VARSTNIACSHDSDKVFDTHRVKGWHAPAGRPDL
jgi:hypothetical protein